MGEVASAFVTLMPSAKGFGKGIGSQIGGDVAKSGQESGRNFGRVWASSSLAPMRAIGAAAVGLFAVSKVKDFFAGAISEARESQKVSALTAQVIKSTGGAAGVSAGQVGDLAQSISNYAGIDDEAIQASENMLLTFTNVRNGVGKGNDIFNQATRTITDMSVALGQDGKSSAIQLGKALNDPIKGVTALQRVGVSFDATQKQQIAGFVKSGNTMAAQKLILAELNKEFGGAAKAGATAGEKASVAWGNFKETVGTAILPALDAVENGFATVVTFLSAKLPGALSTVGNVIRPIIDTVKLFIGAFTGAGADVELPWMNQVIDFGAQARGVFDRIVAIFGTVKAAVMGAFGDGGGGAGALSRFVAFLRGTLLPGIAGVIGAAAGYFRVIAPIVLQVVSTIVGVVQRNLPLIRTIIAQVFGTAADIVRAALVGIRTTIVVFSAIVRATWAVFGSTILGLIRNVFPAVLSVIRGTLNIIQGVVRLFTAVLTGNWRGAWNALGQIVRGVWQVIGGVVRAGVAVLRAVVSAGLAATRAAFSAGWNAFKSIVSGAWAGIRGAVSSGVSSMIGTVRSIPGSIRGALGNLGGILTGAGRELIQGLIRGITDRIRDIKTAMGKVAGAVKGFLPGSPVKEGPLRSWNNGGAGKRLVGLLADGLAYTGPVDSAMAQLASRVNGAAGARGAQLAGLSSSSSAAAGGAAGGTQVIQLVVDGRTLAEIVGDHMGRELAYGRTGA